MENPLVLFEVQRRVGLVTLNHPEKRNALSRAMLESLRAVFSQIGEDRRVKVVVLRAAGTVFSSGHDLKELSAADESAATAIFALCTDVMEAVRKLPQPVIGMVQGLATAAGCQLAATCDLVMAAETALFATPGVKIGLFCTTPSVALCRAVPTKKSLEMLFTGAPITAQEALRVGLVNHVVPAETLEAETWKIAEQIASASAHTLRLGKQAFYQQLPLERAAAYEFAQRCMVENLSTPDAQEGIQAFLGKRPPQWQD
ncbi:MAG: short chain enoyl-CoA hydratase [Planctomycetaceae bacterium]|nr:short chain enoyl-CoA hydratase [Planctomycetaceae bacterium]